MKQFYYLLLLFLVSTYAVAAKLPKENQKYSKPLVVTVSIHLNKIYDINSVHKTYVIDAYLVVSWQDTSVPDWIYGNNKTKIIYENEKFPETILVPSFEFINILGNRDIINKQLIVNPDKTLIYNERFHGRFTSNMDFHKYPNDKQCFMIQLEAFSMEKKDLVFINPQLFPKVLDESYIEEWKILGKKDYVNQMVYNHLSTNKKGEVFSRCNFEIYAQRKLEYYIWKVMLPIGILVVASWLVFWVKDFANQLNISFTLMLTMVTFNFYTSSLLPTLPYNTFIELIIISGYIFIFLTLIAIIFTYAYSKNDKTTYRINTFFKLFFPLLYICYITICIFVIFF
ncbi:hypothetical protein SD960_11615 [Flavobacterium sp. MMLR14_040]|uniref:hypothetical protein n=1 Tax=Flavobacterium sp. MMLR14_040 TaxID=3093843 RepID=UPI0029903B8C|nr:hypothetical protein [Flavobacterium sp. MMLR14_040]MDW8850744.1 hypothetical protein [Flavobacterium sp. MMLR14_040]